jgi:hypothetical protein
MCLLLWNPESEPFSCECALENPLEEWIQSILTASPPFALNRTNFGEKKARHVPGS